VSRHFPPYSQRAKTSLQTKAFDQSPPLVHLQPSPATSAPRETPAGFPPHLLEPDTEWGTALRQRPAPASLELAQLGPCRILL